MKFSREDSNFLTWSHTGFSRARCTQKSHIIRRFSSQFLGSHTSAIGTIHGAYFFGAKSSIQRWQKMFIVSYWNIGIRATHRSPRSGRRFMNEENGGSGRSAGRAWMSAESSVSATASNVGMMSHCGWNWQLVLRHLSFENLIISEISLSVILNVWNPI